MTHKPRKSYQDMTPAEQRKSDAIAATLCAALIITAASLQSCKPIKNFLRMDKPIQAQGIELRANP